MKGSQLVVVREKGPRYAPAVSVRIQRIVALLVALVLGGACREREITTSTSASSPAPGAPLREPEACLPCHAEVVARFERSAHRLAARRFGDARPAASFAPGAPMHEWARNVMSLRPVEGGAAELLVADASGSSLARPPSHVLGGIRREDFVTPLGERSQVLPVSWSVTRGEWMNPVAEELGGPLEEGSPLAWTSERRAHASACARCHPLPEGDEPSGIACATCHGDASAHVVKASGRADATTWARDAMRRQVADPWKGCGSCHALASERPARSGLTSAEPLTAHLLPVPFAGAGGIERSYRIDGTPAIGHGMEVQSLATSPCFVKGGATCITCHDPHGGPGASLKDADPDASCRGCHAAIASDAAAHAGHPVATSPVPSSRQEPRGMATSRLPGCVDCHAPSLLPFGRGDLVRDHAITVPEPVADAAAGIVDSCTGCHADRSPESLERALPRRSPGAAPGQPQRVRRQRLEAFRQAISVRSEADARRAATLLGAIVGDDRHDAWSRASAAHLLTGITTDPAGILPALQRAWETTSDPVLAMSATNAHARLGGPLEPLKERLAREEDWRVALAIGAALASRGDARGLEAVEVIYADETLPVVARADAGSELAVLLIQQGACNRAASILMDSVSKNPSSVPAWLNLGVARACLGDGLGAREAFESVLALQPDHAMARNNLASLDAAEGR